MAEDMIPADDLNLLLAEHRALLTQISELREWATAVGEHGIPHFGEMGTRMEQLRDRLRDHFAEEEKGGYLSPIMEIVPRFAGEIEELGGQHGELLLTLDRFIARLHETEPPFASWQQAMREFEKFIGALRRHESRENVIVQAAYGQDIGAAD